MTDQTQPQPRPSKIGGMTIRQQTSPVLKGLSILLYGMPKVGKTTQAAKFPSPIILNCEPGGTNFLTGTHDIVDVATIDDLDKMVGDLGRSNYKTIIIDGFTWLINHTVRQRAAKTGGFSRMRIYAEVTDQMSRILGELLATDKIIIATGHSRQVDTDDDNPNGVAQRPQGADADEEIQEVRPDINPRLSGGVFGLFSIICYCYASADGARMVTKPIRTAKYRILAGDRSGALDRIMPLDADALMAKLRGTVSTPK